MNSVTKMNPRPDIKPKPVSTWKQFDREVRSKGCSLLKRLDDFPNSILVTGCQRSGTTMVSRIITQSDGMINYWFGHDDELDAALILSGSVDHTRGKGRYCFQTTYLNECYHEYFEHSTKHSIIWILRNPYSVVYSILNNWRRAALNRLFKSCGAAHLEGSLKWIYLHMGVWGVSRLRRACLSYNAKVSQVHDLQRHLSPGQMIVIDYDDLVTNSHEILRLIYRHIDLEYKEEYANIINTKSIQKAKKLTEKQSEFVKTQCMPYYLNAKTLIRSL